MNKSKGFTIIELIVVIAIIAVLASIVLVNVTGYINKGKDAAIKGNLASLLTNSTVFFDTNATYTGFSANTTTGCGTGSPIRAAITAAGGTLTCTETATLWCASSPEKVSTSTYFCVDSSGKKSESTTAICASGACPS